MTLEWNFKILCASNTDLLCCFVFRVTGDRNCLYYATATSIYREESQGLALRLLTIIELFENADYYAVYPHLVETKSILQKTTPLPKLSAVMLLHNFSPKDDNKADCIRDEAIHMCKLREYSSFVCMMALSSVLARKIFSYYQEDAVLALIKY